MRRSRLLALLATTLLVFAGYLVACSDDGTPPKTDGTKLEGGTDMPAGDVVPWPDTTLDGYIWPDTGQDQYVWPDFYPSGNPFGCTSDADCFGQKCCATPWGVKLCAPTCAR
jgi:hypothetical protein